MKSTHISDGAVFCGFFCKSSANVETYTVLSKMKKQKRLLSSSTRMSVSLIVCICNDTTCISTRNDGIPFIPERRHHKNRMVVRPSPNDVIRCKMIRSNG